MKGSSMCGCGAGSCGAGSCGSGSCCEGNDPLVPELIDNPPGQSALRYRVGTYATFFETMLARLSTPLEPSQACEPDPNAELDPLGFEDDGRLRWPLRELETRDADDPTIALLDAWAMVGDVLTFYQERIVNEGYLRTATEQRSVEELARLVGYRPRPGVAASVDLAFALDVDQTAEIPAGTRAQSLPEPGKLPQTYETSEPLGASAAWNALRPLPGVFAYPRKVTLGGQEGLEVDLEGLSANLQINDVVLVRLPGDPLDAERLFRVERVELLADAQTTRVALRKYVLDGAIAGTEWDKPEDEVADGYRYEEVSEIIESFDDTWSFEDDQDDQDLFRAWSDHTVLELVGGDRVRRESFRRALEDRKARRVSFTEFHVFRASSPLFGHNATDKQLTSEGTEVDWPAPGDERDDRLFLDNPNERVRPRDFVVVDPGDVPLKVLEEVIEAAIARTLDVDDVESLQELLAVALAAESAEALREAVDAIAQKLWDLDLVDVGELLASLPRALPRPLDVYTVAEARVRSRTAYGLAKPTLRLILDEDWIDWPPAPEDDAYLLGNIDPSRVADLATLRNVMTYIEPERVRVARTPLESLAGSVLDLDGLVFDLDPGRVLIVEGEDARVPGSRHAERVIISSVVHDLVEVSTRVTITRELEHAYARKHTTIYGNVADATQGESRTEVLGSGDASQPAQEFTLRHQPLTHVPAATVDGAASTLTVRVGGVAWPEAPIQALLGPNDRKVVTRTDEQGRTVVIGGDGWHGARFPTGIENIAAEYRSGQGADGNVDPGKITTLATRPFGVQKVTNPIAASGGAGPDDIEATRMRVPLAVMSLDRLLSVKDHENFALRFAGIAKASSRLVGSKGVYVHWRVQTVVAGNEPRVLEPSSDLIERLREAMQRFGDPALEVEVVPAKLEPLSIVAKVEVTTGYVFHEVAARLRAALTEQLGYAAQGIGQSIHPSRIVAIMHGVVGVDFVDLDAMRVFATEAKEPLIFDPNGLIVPDPDTVLFVDAGRPETLDLEEWKP